MKTTRSALCALILLLSLSANADTSAGSNKGKASASQLKSDAHHPKNQQSSHRRILPVRIYKRLDMSCKTTNFPSPAYILHSGKKREVACVNGKIRLKQGNKSSNLLGHELSHKRKQQGRVLTDSDVNHTKQERSNHHIDLQDATLAPIRQESLSNTRDKNKD